MKKLIYSILTACALCGCANDKEKLHIYTWADYFDPEMLVKFETENNCQLVIDTFDDNESMLAKIQAGATGYDIIMPTSYIIPTMKKLDVLETIDISMLSNVVKHFDKKYDRFLLDTSMKTSIPYAFSITGLAYRYDKISSTNIVESWNLVFDERFNGRICLLNDIREMLGAGLIMSKASVNSVNSKNLNNALKFCRKMKAQAKKLDSVQYRIGLATGEYWLAMGYNSDMLQVLDENPGICLKFFIPQEGSTCGFDEFVIIKNSKKKELAYKFINFFYDPENAAKNAEYICTCVPNKDMFEYLDDEYKTNEFMNPTKEVLNRLELIKDVGPDIKKYNDAWDKFMSIEEK